MIDCSSSRNGVSLLKALDLCWPVKARLLAFSVSVCSSPVRLFGCSLFPGALAFSSCSPLKLEPVGSSSLCVGVLLLCLGSAPEQMVLPHTLARLRPHFLLLVRHMLR